MKFEYQSPVSLRQRLADGAPVDLIAVVLVTIVADLLVVSLMGSWVRLVATLPLLFFLPGYALVSSLYPEANVSGEHDNGSGISWLERVAISFGLSLVIVPIVALVLWIAGLWLSVGAFVAGITTVIFIGVLVGAFRRLLLPPARRFSLPAERWGDELARGLGTEAPTIDRVVNGALVVSIVLAGGLLAFGITNPLAGETYTSAALLSESAEGELVASGYPSEFVAGESQPFALELVNEEGAAVTYTVVVQVERVNTEGGGATVVDAQQLETFTVSLADGEQQTVRHTVAPTMTGEELRLSYYVYKGDAPAAVGADSAYRHLFVWISVSDE